MYFPLYFPSIDLVVFQIIMQLKDDGTVFLIVALEADGGGGLAVMDAHADAKRPVAVVVNLVDADGDIFVLRLRGDDGGIRFGKCLFGQRSIVSGELFLHGIGNTTPAIVSFIVERLRVFQPYLCITNIAGSPSAVLSGTPSGRPMTTLRASCGSTPTGH